MRKALSRTLSGRSRSASPNRTTQKRPIIIKRALGAASINVPTPTGSPNQPSVMGVIAADLMTTDLIPKEDIPLDVVASKVTRMTAVRFFKTLSKINDDVKPLLDIIPETHQNGCIIFYVMDLENPNDPFSRVQDIGRWKINLRQGTICELRGRQDHCHTNAVSIYADDKTMLKILQTKTSLQTVNGEGDAKIVGDPVVKNKFPTVMKSLYDAVQNHNTKL